jgi:uncharacterized protein (DUF433 family)
MEKLYVQQREGGYWVDDTRVSLDSVVVAFLQGLSPETIAGECFPTLTLEQTYGAIAYYLAHHEEIDAYLKRADAEFAALWEATHSASPEFSQRCSQGLFRKEIQVDHSTL